MLQQLHIANKWAPFYLFSILSGKCKEEKITHEAATNFGITER
jgi:hypothetical protein